MTDTTRCVLRTLSVLIKRLTALASNDEQLRKHTTPFSYTSLSHLYAYVFLMAFTLLYETDHVPIHFVPMMPALSLHAIPSQWLWPSPHFRFSIRQPVSLSRTVVFGFPRFVLLPTGTTS